MIFRCPQCRFLFDDGPPGVESPDCCVGGHWTPHSADDMPRVGRCCHEYQRRIYETKARDIIPGWPKGRSVGWNKHNLSEDARYKRYWIFRTYRSTEMEAHAAQEAAYHAGQQAMVNAYFEQYRNPTFPFVHKGIHFVWL